MENAPELIDIVLPDRFVLEVPAERGGWIDYGLYESRLFDWLGDGSYVCAGHGGSPLFLRCLRQSVQEIEVLDGDGQRYIYRLVPFPSPRYQSPPDG